MIGLPVLLKDDGTAKGLTQILLTYTLACVSALLGMATLWLSCGTLARDIEECQMQVVAVKPISRWQIWLGKWLGILGLNALLLALAGAAIFILLQWRAGRLPAYQQQVLRDEIFVARGSMKERPPDNSEKIKKIVDQAVRQYHPTTTAEMQEIVKQVTERVNSANTDVEPNHARVWAIDLHTLPEKTREGTFRLRVKFHTASPYTDAMYDSFWRVGPPTSANAKILHESLPPDSFQEFEVPAHLLDDKGRLFVDMYNPNDSALIFPIDDGFELLYYENTFGVNFIRGLAVIFCWLALLAAIGLAASSELSFPVAAFASMAILLMGLSSGTLQTVVEQGTVVGYDAAAGGYGHSPIDWVFVPVFHGALKIIQLVEGFSPIDFLSTGRSITWGMLGLAVAQIILILGGFFAVCGIILFTRRELATAQGNT